MICMAHWREKLGWKTYKSHVQRNPKESNDTKDEENVIRTKQVVVMTQEFNTTASDQSL